MAKQSEHNRHKSIESMSKEVTCNLKTIENTQQDIRNELFEIKNAINKIEIRISNRAHPFHKLFFWGSLFAILLLGIFASYYIHIEQFGIGSILLSLVALLLANAIFYANTYHETLL